MADDPEQRAFEVVKLRIAFLQHLTTLSGGAILILFALVQRTQSASSVSLLSMTGGFFAFAALASMLGLVWLLSDVGLEEDLHTRGTQGGRLTFFAGVVFTFGIAFAGLGVLDVPLSVAQLGFYVFAAVALVLGILLILRYWSGPPSE